MDIGIGLPNPVPGTPGTRLLEWARRAEERGFVAVATIDRIAYPSYDSLATLAAVGGATSRIGLLTNILLTPVYPPTLLAKATASIDQLAAGRLTLGLAPGRRPDDFAVAGRDFHTRGRDFDAALESLHRMWRGEPVADTGKPVCPTPVRDGRVPVLVGGATDAAIRRTTAWGVGWTSGGAPPQVAGRFVERVRTAWQELAGTANRGWRHSPTTPSEPTPSMILGPTCVTTTPSPGNTRRRWPTVHCARRRRSVTRSGPTRTPGSPNCTSTPRRLPWTKSTGSPTSSSNAPGSAAERYPVGRPFNPGH
jgi:hypothetical protein